MGIREPEPKKIVPARKEIKSAAGKKIICLASQEVGVKNRPPYKTD